MKMNLLALTLIMALVMTLGTAGAATYTLCNGSTVAGYDSVYLTPTAGSITDTFTLNRLYNGSSGIGTYTYTWYCNNVLVSGATGQTFSPKNLCSYVGIIASVNCSNSTHAGTFLNTSTLTLAGYQGTDVSAMVIDGIAKFGIEIIGFVSLMALAVLYIYFKKVRL